MRKRMDLQRWERRVEWPLIVAAVVFLIAYAVQVLADLRGTDRLATEAVMNTVWALFAIEYVIRLLLAPRRLEWFFRNLPDMAVVVFPLLRPLRLLRLVMLFGVLQRSAGGALRGIIGVYTVGATSLLVFVSALAVLDAERHADGATITSFGDAVW